MAASFKNYSSAQTSAGTGQSTAAALVAEIVYLANVGDGEGVILPAGNLNDERIVVNGDTDVELFVYPPSGGKLNSFTTNRAVAVAPNRAARFVCVDNLNWVALL